MLSRRARAAAPCRRLLAAVDALADAAAEAARNAGVAGDDLRWAAARRVVAAAAAARLAARGQPTAGSLFTAMPPGASAGRRAALVLVGAADPGEAARPEDAPPLATLATAYPGLLQSTARKRTGAWFTPQTLAAPTVQRTLAPLARAAGPPPRVCDPAAGGGAFLLAALEHLAAATGRPRGELLAAGTLSGVDLDPTAAGLAALALHEACGEGAPPIARIEAHLRCGDGLAEFRAGSFDAVVGNPPWETLQGSRREGAAAGVDAIGREALRARFGLRGRGKVYTYRLFVARALELLRDGGRLGLIVPASLWFDRDAAPLRERLLDECSWEWLFGFENRRRLFAIDTRYRFAAVVAQRGGRTVAVRTAFGRDDPAEWSAAEPAHLPFPRAWVRSLSPDSGAFVEVRDRRDLELLRHLHAAGEPLLGPAGGFRWRQGDFNMTSDRHRFRLRSECERRGWRRADDGTWRRGAADPVLRPLFQGAMIGDLHPNAGAFAGGDGRAVRWREPRDPTAPEPRYLVAADGRRPTAPARAVLRALSNATNERSAIACLLGDEPCGNSLGVLTPRHAHGRPVRECAFLAGVLGSLVWDWALRQRLAGTNLNRFVLADTVVPRADEDARDRIAAAALQLCALLPWHASLWRAARAEGWLPPGAAPASLPPRDVRRQRLRAALEVEVARAFRLDEAALRWILRDCDHPVTVLRDRSFARGLDAKGFWRVDRDLAPARRLPAAVLLLAARGNVTGAPRGGAQRTDAAVQ